MTGRANLLANYGLTKIADLGDGVIQAIASRDPAMAEAQVKSMLQHADELAGRVGQAQGALTTATNKLKAAQAEYDRDMDAAKEIGKLITNARAASDTATEQSWTNKLNPLMDKIAALKVDIASATGQVTAAQKDVTDWTHVHQQQIQQITTARQTIEQARNDMAHAREDADLAAARKEQALRDQGLRSGLDPTNMVAGSLQRHAAEMRAKAAADSLTADSLQAVSHSGVDDTVAEVLAQRSASTTSDPLERLAALGG